MISLLHTGERITDLSLAGNYIFQRHYFAYHAVIPFVNGTVIELGCGQGYGGNLLSSHATCYTAIDKKRPGKCLSGDINYVKAKLPDLSAIRDTSADTVICFQVIEHIRRDEFLLQEIRRILKPGGQLFMTTPNILTTLTRNPFHIREYTSQQLEELMESIFSEYALQGIFGNEKILEYYERNKKMVERICSLDILNLQHLLPSWMLRTPYTILNNMSRIMLFRNSEDSVGNIHSSDFYLDKINDDCLDLFVHAKT